MRTVKGMGVPSMKLVASYIFDWICIIAIAAVGAGWEYVFPYNRPFSPVDLNISYPFQHHETIPTWLLIIIALVIPAGIVFVVCMVFVPGPTATRGTPKALIWRRKLWELNIGWMGLALSLATAFMITQGMKLMFGKPRPDLLSRCQPNFDLIKDNLVNPHMANVFPNNTNWVMVTSKICTNQDRSRGGELMDGFKSFPSGHSSFSWAGLLYLTLFLASKFAVAIPFLPPRPYSTNPAYTSAVAPSNLKKKASMAFSAHKQESNLSSPSYAEEYVVPIRYQNAAPPVYTLILILIPIGAAIYVCASRFVDYRHFGFDILFGSLIGITTSWFSFRFYHLPITRGAGWAWGPRSYDRAWGIGVGHGSYVGTEGWSKSGRSETQGLNGNGQGVLHEERESDVTATHAV
ncbi:acid phosphatase/Vanadium-dependent haloperoxidase [Ophiobolus disseminans]|uniref:Acid phosphatase/Vanadium-dependent haloperoxidase n=1 Tax=Ophiobolus disseminans TaxID=1469910 RepID=A0A6A7AIK1_9PLEO|nr:acid phosphatase/Vanadium-dependent haloperoxidase [Ophiobolus disseminans]